MRKFKIDNLVPFMSVPSILHYVKHLRKLIEAEKELKLAYLKELIASKNQLELAEAEKADLKADCKKENNLQQEIRRLTKSVMIEKREKEKFELFANILFNKLVNDYKENADELKSLVFGKTDEIKSRERGRK